VSGETRNLTSTDLSNPTDTIPTGWGVKFEWTGGDNDQAISAGGQIEQVGRVDRFYYRLLPTESGYLPPEGSLVDTARTYPPEFFLRNPGGAPTRCRSRPWTTAGCPEAARTRGASSGIVIPSPTSHAACPRGRRTPCGASIRAASRTMTGHACPWIGERTIAEPPCLRRRVRSGSDRCRPCGAEHRVALHIWGVLHELELPDPGDPDRADRDGDGGLHTHGPLRGQTASAGGDAGFVEILREPETSLRPQG